MSDLNQDPSSLTWLNKDVNVKIFILLNNEWLCNLKHCHYIEMRENKFSVSLVMRYHFILVMLEIKRKLVKSIKNHSVECLNFSTKILNFSHVKNCTDLNTRSRAVEFFIMIEIQKLCYGDLLCITVFSLIYNWAFSYCPREANQAPFTRKFGIK